jgi:hypothetical protein
MKKLFALVFPLTIALAASLGCASANATARYRLNGAVVPQAAKTQSGLTHSDVYNDLLKAENDGTISRLNATLYAGS